MTSKMIESQDIIEEHCYVDRISHLPRDVIECIMEFLPVRDAARTCVLSSMWRYVWADYPSLVLDCYFWQDIRDNRLPNKLDIDYVNIVSRIMLYHVGHHIRRFVIDVSDTRSMLHSTIDLWVSSLCRRGLKELEIENSYNSFYQVPCCVLSTATLTHLSLNCCIIKAKDSRVCFTNIQSLNLCHVTLDSSVLTTPLLTSLTLEYCSLMHDFEIYAPRLASLILNSSEYPNLKPFLTCTCIDYAHLFSFPRSFLTENTGCFVDGESLNLVKLLATWPRISEIAVDSMCLKYLSTGSVPCILQLNNLRYLALDNFNLDSGLIAWIVCILQNSPLLHTFEIWFGVTNLEQVNDIAEPPAVITRGDLRMEQLGTIKMMSFRASRNEVMFAKILLQCAPLLEKMIVQENKYLLNPNKRIYILNKLLLLQRAFPKPQIIYGPPIIETML